MQSPEEFMEAYCAVWVSPPDGDKIADFYQVPCLSLRGDGSFLGLQTRAEVTEYFRSVAGTYDQLGIDHPTFKDFTSYKMGSRSVVATATWVGHRADGSVVREWRVSYSLVEFDGHWRIVLATTHLA